MTKHRLQILCMEFLHSDDPVGYALYQGMALAVL